MPFFAQAAVRAFRVVDRRAFLQAQHIVGIPWHGADGNRKAKNLLYWKEMHTKSLALLFGLLGMSVGAALGMHGERFSAHFGQRLRERPATMVTMEQKRVLLQRLQRLPSDSFHGAAPKKPFQTMHPVSVIPNWGAMQNASAWNRPYDAIPSGDLVPVPVYDLPVLTFPMRALDARNTEDIPLITAKLYYSTRFFGRYDLDAGEFTGPHAGVDLKLPYGTPVGAIADGIVHAVRKDDRLGLFVILRHTHPTEGTLFSMYGHLASAQVHVGQQVRSGERIGAVGRTGLTSAPHLHLQIDRPQKSGGTHVPFITYAIPRPEDIDRWTINPVRSF